MGWRSLRHSCIRRLPCAPSINAHAYPAAILRHRSISPHLGPTEVVGSTHYPPHLSADSRVKRDPVSGIAPLLRNSSYGPRPRSSPIFAAKEPNVRCGNETAACVKWVEQISVVGRYIQPCADPIAVRDFL